MAASGGGPSRAEVGDNDGGQHAAPPALHDHHAQDLSLRLRHNNLDNQVCLKDALKGFGQDLTIEVWHHSLDTIQYV